MIKLYSILAIIIFVSGCGAITNFIVGATGNVFSDTVNREVEKQINSDCKK